MHIKYFLRAHIRLVLISIAILVIFIVLLLRFWPSSNTSQISMVSTNVRAILQTTRNALNKSYPTMFVTGTLDWRAESDSSTFSPALTMPGNTTVKSNRVPGLVWAWEKDTPTPEKMYRYVAETLVQAGFAQDTTGEEQKIVTGDIPSFYMTYNFHRGEVKCMIISTENVDADELRCYDAATLQDSKRSLNVFAQAYGVARKRQPSLPAISSYEQARVASQNTGGVISASENAGYDIAEVSVRPAGQNKLRLALFYEHQGQWHYVTTADDEYGFSCGDMRLDSNARIALHDQICYDYVPGGGTRRLDTDRHY